MSGRSPGGRRLAALTLAAGIIALPLLSGPALGLAAANADEATPTPVTMPAPAGGSVTVDQTTGLVNQTVHVSWSGFKPSSATVVHPANTEYVVRVYECRGAAPAGPQDCYGSSVYTYPDQSDTSQVLPDGPTNALDAATDPSGKGGVDIEVRTSAESTSLACSTSSPCSLVVIPNNGDPSDHSTDFIYATTSYMDSEWAWADHVTIPLSFAPTGDSCPLNASSISLNGGPMLERAITSWQPQICQGSDAVALDYTALGETQGRAQFLAGTADIGLTSEPAGDGPPATRAYGYAPLTADGIAVGFHIDDALDGQPINNLVLTPRLVAKMLTESYGETGYVAAGDPVGAGNPNTVGNPYSLFTDPEFLALNPGHYWPSVSTNPLIVSGNNDMIYELTRWLNSDKTTRDWLDGKPDQYGMHVNTAFKGVTWPATSLELADSYPALGYTFVPIAGLDHVARALVANQPSSSSPTADETGAHAKDAQQLPGNRTLIAFVDTANAAAFHFPLASLRNAAGKDVLPTTESLTAGLAAMKATSAGTMESDPASTDPAAYPLTMVQYAMAPTSGLDTAKAKQIATFLQYAAVKGQVTGTQQGGLPDGYLPLPSTLQKELVTVTDAVAHQTGQAPGGTQTTTPAGTTPTTDSQDSPFVTSDDGSGTGDFTDTGSTDTGSTDNPAPATGTTATPTASATNSPAKVKAVSYQPAKDDPGAIKLFFPLLIALAATTALAGPALLALGPERRASMAKATRKGSKRLLRRGTRK
jgi:ABC-type phosphate transport system substrate-binding protein